MAFIACGRKQPARYRLLFSDPDIAARGGSLEQAAMQTMQAFASIVAAYQENGCARELPSRMVTALVYATLQRSRTAHRASVLGQEDARTFI
jgi:hypothetical protein